MRLQSAFFASLILSACAPHSITNVAPPAPLAANDNRVPAGTLHGGVLSLHLQIVERDWQAENALPAWPVLAFAEAGKPATTPGPLIRVASGTTVEVDIDNRTGNDVFIVGLYARPADEPMLPVTAHGTARTRFRLDSPGTYFYWGTLGKALGDRFGHDSELNGAIVVDAPGARTDDRIFVLTRHGAAEEGGDGLGAWAINGRSWPQTERLSYRVGDDVRWRVINASESRHPMHLHGTYFRVSASGDNVADVALAPDAQKLAVTHSLASGSTMALSWSPEQPGNWLFHCHILFHVLPENRIPPPAWYEDYADLPHDQHMAGLVLGIHVDGAPGKRDTQGPRHIALRVGERPGVAFDEYFQRPAPGLGYAVDDAPLSAPGAPIVLERGRPVEIAIRNDLKHSTSVHWHGIELESYYDGVPHWGSDGTRTTPSIEAGGSFVARFTPPRAGTFIYHTHFNDYAQLTAGLYGALIVVEPGHALDPATDHAFVISQGPDDFKDPLLLNGAAPAAPSTWRTGRHRLRLIGITAATTVDVSLLRDGAPVVWRALAKDGADLPPALARDGPATARLSPGETFDFEYAADAPENLQLELRADGSLPSTSAAIAIVR